MKGRYIAQGHEVISGCRGYSSANAKKWEVELHTLKNNNARLTTALQESTANVEEWKRQLATYKEESARMKLKACHLSPVIRACTRP